MPLNSHDDICADDGCWTPDICSNDGCWPGVYLIGAQKAATTSLSSALAGVLCLALYRPNEDTVEPPAVAGLDKLHASTEAGGAVQCSEVHAWDGSLTKFNALLEHPQRYSRLFRAAECPRRQFLDATPDLHHWLAPVRMRNIVPPTVLPQLRLIAVLREPIARDLSYFNHVVGEGNSTSAQLNLAPLCDASSYAANVRCELEKWEACVRDAGTANRTLMEQYAACPGWDRVIMRSKMVTGRHLVGQGGHFLQLARGAYAAQLTRWTQSGFARSQLLVLSFEALTLNYYRTLRQILAFARVGGGQGLDDAALAAAGVPLESLDALNSHAGPRKVRTIPCATQRELERFFGPWNGWLYKRLADERARGAAPPQEEAFAPFAERVRCV